MKNEKLENYYIEPLESHKLNIEPVNTLTFNNKDQTEIGRFDFNGDKLKFEGDVEESAKLFIEFLLNSFNKQLNDLIEEEVQKRLENHDG